MAEPMTVYEALNQKETRESVQMMIDQIEGMVGLYGENPFHGWDVSQLHILHGFVMGQT